MLDYQRTIDNIRTILAAAGSATPQAVASVAAEYADACAQANERLRACGRLLGEGLRSEAIQQCEADPNLLNLFATLDFPERSDWCMLLRANGIANPEPLLVDVAADLNEAYAVEQPMAVMLRRHRLLALSRGPLRDRIGVLRKLADLDATNPVWTDDLRTFERARQQEIRQSADEECRRGNVAVVEELATDLQSDDWLEKPSAGLVKQVTESYAKLVRAKAREEIAQLEPQLNDAFSQFDVDRGRALRERWNACAAMADIDDQDAAYQNALPALDWLAEQDRASDTEASYKSAVMALEAALDDETVSAPQLERLAHAVVRHDREIPAVLEQRYRTRVAGLELGRSRRLRLLVAGAAVLILLIIAGVTLTVVRQRRAELLAAHVSTLTALIDQGLFDEAQQHLTELSASDTDLATEGQIQDLGVTLATTLREEQTRRADFTKAIEAAESAGIETPDRESLAEAIRLARLDADKARVQKLDSAVKSADRQRQKDRDDGFLAGLKEISAQIDKVDRAHPDEGALALARQALAAHITGSKEISESVFAQGGIARARIDALYKTIERNQKVTTNLTAISGNVGNIPGFKQSLEAFIAAFPESAQAVDFQRVTAEADLWKEVEIWNKFIDAWPRDIAALDSAKARELLNTSNEMIRDHGNYPVAATLQKRLPFLEAIGRRADDRGTKLYAPLNELFSDPLVAGLWMIEVTDDKQNVTRYFLVTPPPQPRENQPSLHIKYIVDFSREPKRTKDLPVKNISFRGPSPQSTIAKSVMDELAAMNDATWEATFFRLVGAINANEQLEPILKIIFLQKVLEVGCQGSDHLKAAFARYQDVLSSVPIDPAVPWMDPQSEDAQRLRPLAIDLLRRLPSLRDIGIAAATSLKEFKAPLGDRYKWIGWISRDSGGTWQLNRSSKDPIDGELFIATPAQPGKGLAWAAVGKIRGGVAELDQFTQSAFVQGRPVFIVAGSSPARPTPSGAGK